MSERCRGRSATKRGTTSRLHCRLTEDIIKTKGVSFDRAMALFSMSVPGSATLLSYNIDSDLKWLGFGHKVAKGVRKLFDPTADHFSFFLFSLTRRGATATSGLTVESACLLTLRHHVHCWATVP